MFESSVYRNRRKALREKVSSGIILILGNNEALPIIPIIHINSVKTARSSISSDIHIPDMQECWTLMLRKIISSAMT